MIFISLALLRGDCYAIETKLIVANTPIFLKNIAICARDDIIQANEKH